MATGERFEGPCCKGNEPKTRVAELLGTSGREASLAEASELVPDERETESKNEEPRLLPHLRSDCISESLARRLSERSGCGAPEGGLVLAATFEE